MLVTLGSNASIGAGGTQSFQYACDSFQKIQVNCSDSSDALDGFLTVQIGNEVILNDVNFEWLGYLSMLNGGGDFATSSAVFILDFGSHILDSTENLYVTVRNGDASNALDALDISAIVNESGNYAPRKITGYSDTVFTDTNTLQVIAFGGTDIEEATGAVTIRNQAYSSAPAIASGSMTARGMTYGSTIWRNCSVLATNQVPMNTSVNYSATEIDVVLCISGMDRQPSKQAEATRTGRNLVRQMTPAEAKAL